MLFYYIHYLLVAGFSGLTVFSKRATKYVFLIVFLLLFLFAACRGDIGRDYHVYVSYFKVLASKDLSYYIKKIPFYEPCNYFLPVISKSIVGVRYFLYLTFAMFAFLGVYFKLRAFRMSVSFFLSVMLYVTNFFLLHEMTQIRAGISTGIFLLFGTRYIYQRNLLGYVLCILGASFFHYSSVVFLPLYFLNPFKLDKRVFGGLLIGASILSILRINILNPAILSFVPKIQVYMELIESEGEVLRIWNNPGFLINLFVTSILFVKSDLVKDKNPYFLLFLKVNIVSLLCYMLLAGFPIFAIRISQMFGVVQLLLFPTLVFVFREKFVGYLINIFVSLIYFYNHYIRLELFSPYQAWWQMKEFYTP